MTKLATYFMLGLVLTFVVWASLSNGVSFNVINIETLPQDIGLGLVGTITVFYWIFLTEAGLYRVYLKFGVSNSFVMKQSKRGAGTQKNVESTFNPTKNVGRSLLPMLMYCFAEELFFRGVIHAEFGLIAGITVFVLFHDIKNIGWSVQLVGMGLVCGLLYEHTGSLVAPTATHFCVNALSLTRLSMLKTPAN